VQGLDRYAYVNNSPVNYVDSTGHFKDDETLAEYLGFSTAEEMYKSNLWAEWADAGILDQIRSEDFDFGNLISIEYDDGTIKSYLLSQGCFNNCSEHDLIFYDVDSGKEFTSTDIRTDGSSSIFDNVKSGALFQPTSNDYDSFTFLSGNAALPAPKLKDTWMNGQNGDISLRINWDSPENRRGATFAVLGAIALTATIIAAPPAGAALTVAYLAEGGSVIYGGWQVLTGPKIPQFHYNR
jgi:hypothetical protein